MDRYTAIQQLVTALKEIDGNVSPYNPAYTFQTNLYDGVEPAYLFIDEVNSFPTVTVTSDEERIVHLLSDERMSVLNVDIRGYTYDEEVEQSGEVLSEDIEHVLTHYKDWATDLEDVKLTMIRTDAGLHAPYGVCIFTVVVLFIR